MTPSIYDQLIPLYMLFPVLGAVALWDLREMRIPNELPLLGLAIFALAAPVFLDWQLIPARLIAGAACFAICFALFSFNQMGGGDAKVLPVLLLFIPTKVLPLFAFGFSGAMVIGMAAMFLMRLCVNRQQAAWASFQPNAKYPMGLAIALSGLVLPALVYAYGQVFVLP